MITIEEGTILRHGGKEGMSNNGQISCNVKVRHKQFKNQLLKKYRDEAIEFHIF